MSDNKNSITNSEYDRMPYESFPYHQSSPQHLKTIGTLFGMKPPALETARVLELGSAAGGNIIPFAVMFPKSHCIGIDLSKVQIDQGKEEIKKLGLKNIELKAMSITDVDHSLGKFDYIITHGVFSWVPDFVREKMLEICGTMLSDNGISYISYNTLPGWNMVRSIREMMLFHSSGFPNDKDKVQQARLLLQFLKDGTETQKTPYAEFLKTEAELLANQPDHYIRHEHLEDTNHQMYFSEFMAHSAKYGLQYLGDASLTSMYLGNLPEKVSEKLAEIKDIVRVEQYMDYFTNRRFRSTLLCKSNVQLNRALSFNDIEKFYVSMKAQPEKPESEVKLEDSLDTLKFFFNNNKEVNISTSSPYMKAIIYTMAEHSNTMLKVEDILKEASKKLKNAKPEDLRNDFVNNAMKLVLSGYMTISSDVPRHITKTSNKPVVSDLVRFQCEHTPNFWITNLKHERLSINIFDKFALRYLDGKNSLDNLKEIMLEHVMNGDITISRNNVKLEEKAEIEKEINSVIDQMSSKLEQCAILIK